MQRRKGDDAEEDACPGAGALVEEAFRGVLALVSVASAASTPGEVAVFREGGKKTGQSAPVLELLPGEDEALVVRDALLGCVAVMAERSFADASRHCVFGSVSGGHRVW